ncbi:MAG: rhomboid family intramembrane serine protease [Planctomycetota bacterium]
MGLYDRDYGRDDMTPWDRAQRGSLNGPRSIVVTLIIINVIVWLLDIVVSDSEGAGLITWFGVRPQTLLEPWRIYEVLTYGFLHDTSKIFHLLFNMFVLFVFGRAVEQRIGGQEFLKVYLAAIIVGGITAVLKPWVTGLILSQSVAPGVTIGASGAVVAVMVLFACYYPDQEVLFMFIFPMKAWVLAMVLVAADLLGAMGIIGNGSPTAYEVHLAGATFGFLYVNRGWSFRQLDLSRITELPLAMRDRSRRAKLKIHDPDRKLRAEAEEADRILAKIHALGEDSLTSAERKTLQRYSRRQRQRRES